MADRTRLLVVSCSSLAAAEDALAGTRELKGVRDAAIVTCTERGRVELRQTHQVAAGEGVVAGGTVGFVAGMLLGGPIGGALLGMLGGGALASRDIGLPDARLRELGESLTPEGALLCLLADADATAAVSEKVAAYGEVVDADASGVP